jgi:hypothetical protein
LSTISDAGTAAALNVPAAGNAAAGEVVKGNDGRLTDSRTPTAHASTHASAGSDPITIAESQVTNLTTDLAAKAPLASPTFTGTPAAPTATAGTNTTQLATTAFVTSAVAAGGGGGGGGGILAALSYSGGSTATVSTTSSTMADVDATNLAITFDVPASGKVVVTLNGWLAGAGPSTTYNWGLRESTTTVADAIVAFATGSAQFRETVRFLITGLTPGASKTYKWAHRLSSGSNSSGITYGGANIGITMTVESAA